MLNKIKELRSELQGESWTDEEVLEAIKELALLIKEMVEFTKK